MTKVRKLTLTAVARLTLAAGSSLLCGQAPPRASDSTAAAEAAKASVGQNYGKLPMSFEENRGQTDRQVKYLSQGQGYSLFLTSSGVVMSLQCPAAPSGGARHAAIGMSFLGADAATPAAEGQLPGKSSYFIGNDPSKWVTNAANYSRVRYRNLYPGVDLVFYGNQQQLEYDLVVSPGTDPKAIRLHFDGIDSLALDSAGNLLLRAGGGEVRQHRPVVYQERAGARQAVEGRYAIKSRDQVTFQLAAYDKSRPLVIDPVLSFATYLGATGEELFGLSEAASNGPYPAAAVDFQGSVYVTGYTSGSGFPGPPTVLTAGGVGGGTDVFVVKLSATGTSLLYSVVLGGSFPDIADGIAVDASGNAYITGYTSSLNFPITPGAPQAILHGSTNAFVAEVNAAGNALVYSTYLGGTGRDFGHGIAVDAYGNAYVTGSAQESAGTNFPLVNPLSSTPSAGFLAEINAGGTAFLYSTFLSAGAGIGYGAAVDSAGNAYVTGTTGSILSPSPAQGYVLKVNAGGSSIGYGPVLLGTSGQTTAGFSIALDSSNNAYVTGFTTDANFPQITGGAAQSKYGGGVSDAFVVELNSGGSLPPVYGTYIGGVGSNVLPERGSAIGVDFDGNAYVAGTTQCIGFPVTNSVSGARNGSPSVLMQGTVSGSSSTWSANSLSGNFDQVTAIAFDSTGTNFYAGGNSTNATGGGIYKSTNSGSSWALSLSLPTVDALAVDPNNSLNVYAISGGGIYLTNNAGSTWSKASQGVGSYGALAVARTNPSTVYAGSTTGLVYSTNSGVSWSPTTMPPPTGGISLVIAVDPNNANTVYAGTNAGVYKTTTGAGGTWSAVNTGLPSPIIVTSLTVNSASTVYAATLSGLFYSTNGGSSWSVAPLGSIAATPHLVAVDAANNVYLSFEGTGIAVGTGGGTTPGSWGALTYNGLSQNPVLSLAVPPGSTGTAYAGIVAATTAFLTRINPGGQSFSFSTCIGGSDNNLGQGVAVTQTGTAYISGATFATNFPTTPGVVQPASAGKYDDFVARIDNVPFTDVAPSNPFFNFINAMYVRKITSGCLANPPQYCPDATTTRGEMAVFLITAIEGNNPYTYTLTPYFSDVPATHPFFKWIQKLTDLGITGGCSPGLFCPDDPVTRGEMAVFVIASRYGKIQFSYPSTPYFTDVPVSNPFFPFVQKMAQQGITAGCTPTTFCPDVSLTRGQMAVFIITGLTNQFLPLTSPVITQITPSSGSVGQTLTATLWGIATHFVQGTTLVTAPPGITVSNVSVVNPTLLTMQLAISPTAASSVNSTAGSPYSFVVDTGTEEAMTPNVFIVH